MTNQEINQFIINCDDAAKSMLTDSSWSGESRRSAASLIFLERAVMLLAEIAKRLPEPKDTL